MSFLEDLSRLKWREETALPVATDPVSVEARALQSLTGRVNVLAAHMTKQLREHNQAIANTNALFEHLLSDLETLCFSFREAFRERDIADSRIYAQVDADRSVGILNILWHTVSFTTRGNTKPLALFRPAREPVFTGRILALRGDFRELATVYPEQDYPGLLQEEIASLYVPADPTAPAVMKVRHLGEQEHYLHQADASRLFLLKTVEMVCGGGVFHEIDG